MLVAACHAGLEGLEEEREAVVRVMSGTASGGLYGSEKAEGGAEPIHSKVRAKTREVGEDNGEEGAKAEG